MLSEFQREFFLDQLEKDLKVRRVLRKKGAALIYKTSHHFAIPVTAKKRNPITQFSRASRLRFLKYLAGIEWSKLHYGHFLTFTFPDPRAEEHYETRTRWRAELLRRMERHVGRLLCGLWRWEFMPRKTGMRKGQSCPHLHLVMFDLPFISYNWCRKTWREVIGFNAYVDFQGEQIPSGQNASYYIAKYAAKVSDPSSLGICAYLRTPGRFWGPIREDIIPRFDIVWAREPTEAEMEILLEFARECIPWQDKKSDRGFCLFGGFAKAMERKMLEMGLTMYTREP